MMNRIEKREAFRVTLPGSMNACLAFFSCGQEKYSLSIDNISVSGCSLQYSEAESQLLTWSHRLENVKFQLGHEMVFQVDLDIVSRSSLIDNRHYLHARFVDLPADITVQLQKAIYQIELQGRIFFRKKAMDDALIIYR